MKKVEYIEVEKVSHLIPGDLPNKAVLDAIFLGKAFADMWVDDDTEPSMIFVNTKSLFSFALGEISEASMLKIFQEIQINSPFYLYIDKSHYSLLPVIHKKFTKMLQFKLTYPEKLNDLQSLPPGFSLKKIDDENFNRCQWYDLMVKIFDYLRYAKGYCIYNKGKIVSEAHTGYISKNMFEIATITDEKYRRKNLSSHVNASLITCAKNSGFTPIWSCEESNIASTSLAKKLGFMVDRKYSLVSLH